MLLLVVLSMQFAYHPFCSEQSPRSNPQADKTTSLQCALSRLNKVGRGTRELPFSFTAWAGGGEAWETDQTLYNHTGI